ncbi:two-component system response regulator [Halorientalis sp. IM1011]|uniref:response regulator n=1 Tax=Halorientalis sp. IM1011 TaxID=1932360 RepID=UPI00097CC928|nr:response regulator [Halorientalis sp. IM1011]AQL41382.1 two-component system response regulator [Halorientalis sp. IM1011]
MTSDRQTPIEVLLAEDNPGDVKLTQKAFEQGNVMNNLHVVNDGIEAMQYLRQENEYADSPRPDLILLDLNMPRKDGKEVLKDIKDDPELKRIPVVILTSSEAEEDIVSSYDLHANAYLTKPVDFDGFLEVVNTIEDFWLTVVKVPPE